jgi:purine-binding chemotaxis protein CheW
MSTRASVFRRAEEAASSLIELCSVRVGESSYGIPISHVVEILGSVRAKPVPLAPNFVGGLVHYRGDVLTTVSLRQLLGLSRTSGTQDILVLESPAGCFGLLVDAVGEVLTVREEDFEPNPSTLSESRADLFAGAFKLKGSLLVSLNPERLDPIRLGAVYAG